MGGGEKDWGFLGTSSVLRIIFKLMLFTFVVDQGICKIFTCQQDIFLIMSLWRRLLYGLE